MRTLQEIKEEYATGLGHSSWAYLSAFCTFKMALFQKCMDDVTKRFALEYGQALLQKAANSEHTFVNGGSIVTFNKAEKIAILNTKLDLT